MSKKVVLAGGSGFLGESLAHHLMTKGYEVVILSRGNSVVRDGIAYVHWDAKTVGDWCGELEGCEAVVNLTGKRIDCIYTKKNKEEIISSRVNSVNVLHEAIRRCAVPSKVFVQASALAIYGDTQAPCDENASHADDFSADVCKRWEGAFFGQDLSQTRQVVFRIGIVMGKDGGALEPLEKMAKMNLGGTVGSGKQYISWIHVDDLNAMWMRAIEDETMVGVYNAAGPAPATNKEFMKTLRSVLGKGWAPPAPIPFVWLGAYLFMRVEPKIALGGLHGVPKRLVEEGFRFRYNNLQEALRAIYTKE